MSYSVGGPNVWYMAELEDRILASVDRAIGSLSPGAVHYGAIDFRQIGCNRRVLRGDRVTMEPNPQGFFDGHTPILRLERRDAPYQIILVGHACHPTDSGAIEQWSPAYPGALRETLAGHRPETRAMFVQGCGADAKIVHRDAATGKVVFSADPGRARDAGERLGRAVVDYLQKGTLIPLPGAVTCALAAGELGYGEPWSPEELARQAYDGSKRHWQTWAARQALARPDTRTAFRYDVQVWKFADRLTLFGMEGEVCSPWGPKLRALAATDAAMVVAYANSTGSYIPDRRIMREGGYEVYASQQAYALPAPFTENIEAEIGRIVRRALAAAD
jgi:hypothetical protein